jgi:hypothetical protein
MELRLTLEFLAVQASPLNPALTCLQKNPKVSALYQAQRKQATHGNRNSEVV